MSGGGGGASAASASTGQQSLAFRVMRLCRPSLHVESTPLLFDPSDLVSGEDDPISVATADGESADLTYRSRFLLNHPSDSIGLPSLLVLPQAFGAIYLGETFCSYISINNSSKLEVRDVIIKGCILCFHSVLPQAFGAIYLGETFCSYISINNSSKLEVRDVIIKAEIQTERQRILLLDTSKSPVESIRAGGRYDFIVEHDVKELGAHTLVCTALYNDGEGERKYLPQFFKFVVANPLSVRTKVRVVKETTYLEACLENHTKTSLFMDQVDFEPAQNWSATLLKADDHHSESNDMTREIFKPPTLIRSGGGIHNYLYQLKQSSEGSSGPVKVHGSNILGKLQITWRTNLGEPGRLQTQQILGGPVAHKEVELRAVDVPAAILLEKPFMVSLNLTNQTDRALGPFEVWLAQSDLPDERVIMINGLQTLVLKEIEAFGYTSFQLNLIATRLGVQKITCITLFDTKEKTTYDSLIDLEIFVDLDQVAKQ